jgi:phosphoribosylaminoimidazolecarboxamide formyltransferase / IMP cyclohydrolase
MSIRNMRGEVNDLIPVKNVIVSVFDKTGLEQLVPSLIEVNKDVRLLSTGGTFGRIRDILGDSYEDHLVEIAAYTEFPEMEGGLVKTLHPKIHAGLLGERNNPEHQRYLAEKLNGGVYIDMVVVNLYPFEKVIGSPNVNFEKARGNVDIGGPTMIRAAAKNFPSCAVVCDPIDYQPVLEHIRENNGSTSFNQRFQLASKVFDMTARYDKSIADYFDSHTVKQQEVRSLYTFLPGVYPAACCDKNCGVVSSGLMEDI